MSNLLLLAGALALAQAPSDPWLTVRTEHFRIHYPEEASVWAEGAASRLEEWHSRVVEEIGFQIERRIDVVVVDPYSDANGLAVPWGRAPRIMAFATAPEASSPIGHYRSWDEILLVHEDAHLMHLLRPPRNGLERLVYGLSGIGPIAIKAPRWVVEGYATVVEGRLTGFGRPHDDERALLLRRLAQQGQMPSYPELSASGRFAGRSFAYLAGSAYLEWLEARAGQGSLKSLWARMSSRELRTFDQAFEGVFGAPPSELYGRFVAETTASAMAIEEALPPDEAPFQRIGGDVGAPAVSPEGDRVAVPIFPRGGLPRVDIWSTGPDDEAVERRAERLSKLAERDPQDVAPVDPPHPPHQRLDRRVSGTFAAREIRWMPDGGSLLFSAWARDRSGRLRPDLYRWTLDRRKTERITRRADLRSPDPAPDGTWAAAVHSSWGRTEIVRVDLSTGEQIPLVWTEGGELDGPRISPDGERIAWLENDGRGWGVAVRDLTTGAEWRSDPCSDGPFALDLAWSRDGRAVLASVGEGGRIEVHEVWRDGGRGKGRLTATAGGASSLEPLDDRRVIFLSTSYRGLDLHTAPLAEIGPLPEVGSPPVRRLPMPDAPGIPEPAEISPRPYGLGQLDLQPLLGASAASANEQGQIEIGVRMGDPVGRSELLLIGALASPEGGMYGGRAALTWDGLPVRLGLDGTLGGDDRFGLRRAGLGLTLADRTSGPWWVLAGRLAGLYEAALPGDRVGDRRMIHADAGFSAVEPTRGGIGAGIGLRATFGTVAGQLSCQGVAAARVRILRDRPILVSYERGISSGPSVLSRFALGGVPSSVGFDPANLWRIQDPAFGAGMIDGQSHDRVEIGLETPVAPYAVRHRFGARLGAEGLSAVGLRAGLPIERQPFFRLPSGRLDAGVACRVEWPGLGWDARPCVELSDYALWGSLTWER